MARTKLWFLMGSAFWIVCTILVFNRNELNIKLPKNVAIVSIPYMNIEIKVGPISELIGIPIELEQAGVELPYIRYWTENDTALPHKSLFGVPITGHFSHVSDRLAISSTKSNQIEMSVSASYEDKNDLMFYIHICSDSRNMVLRCPYQISRFAYEKCIQSSSPLMYTIPWFAPTLSHACSIKVTILPENNFGFVKQPNANTLMDFIKEQPDAFHFNAFSIRRASSSILVGNRPALNFQNEITISLWIISYVSMHPNERCILSHGGWEERYKLSILPNDYIRWTIHIESDENLKNILDCDSKVPLSKDQWHLILVTYSANGDVHIMIDGIDQLGTCSIDTKQEDFFGKLSPSKEDILIGRCKSTDHFSVALMADIGQIMVWQYNLLNNFNEPILCALHAIAKGISPSQLIKASRKLNREGDDDTINEIMEMLALYITEENKDPHLRVKSARLFDKYGVVTAFEIIGSVKRMKVKTLALPL